MSTPAETRVRTAHDAIAEAEREAKRLVEEARINFGAVANEVTSSGELQQEQIAATIGKTREYVRRLQVKARNKGEK